MKPGQPKLKVAALDADAFTRLLEVPGVSCCNCFHRYDLIISLKVLERLGLSFNNSRSLQQTIDSLPGLAPWSRCDLTIDTAPASAPDASSPANSNSPSAQTFELYFRDPIECLKALWANPVFLPYMNFQPIREYTDKTRKTRRYNEMNTGDWWWETQVCSLIS